MRWSDSLQLLACARRHLASEPVVKFRPPNASTADADASQEVPLLHEGCSFPRVPLVFQSGRLHAQDKRARRSYCKCGEFFSPVTWHGVSPAAPIGELGILISQVFDFKIIQPLALDEVLYSQFTSYVLQEHGPAPSALALSPV